MKEYFNHILDKAFDNQNHRLSNPKAPEDLKKIFDLNLEEAPSTENPLKIIDQIFEHSVNTQNPRFLNQLYGGSTPESWLGELLTAVLNTSMATYEIAPLATLMEQELIKAMNEAVGFKQASGLIVPGGSYANMLGIHTARFHYQKDLKEKGLLQGPSLKVLVSKNAHYSAKKSMNLLGLGTDSLVKIEVDANHKMDIQDLKKQIQLLKAKNEVPMCIISTAGTTVWGSFDPIEEINDICKQENIWHHVDAAWGGLVLWSERKAELFKGVEHVDSITLDFHKLMASTLTKGIFLTAREETFKNANSGGGSKYIFHDKKAIDTGLYAIQCGRKVDSLPLWLQWKLRGTKQFRDKITELYDLSDWLMNFLKSNTEKYKVLLEPEFMNFCFQIIPKNPKANFGEFNLKMREELMNRGNFMVNFSRDDEHGAFFRLVFNHWGVNKDILVELFEELDQIQSELE